MSWSCVLLVGWAVGVGGCDGDGTRLLGDASDLPLNPAGTLGNRCRTDDECDDGEPCNGEESCDPGRGRCVGGTPLPDFTQCMTPEGRYASCLDARCDLDYEEMFVPAGPFVMGADRDEDISCLGPAAPAWPKHIVVLSGYFIDRYEVTNKKYARCHARGVCPAHREGSFLRPNSYYTNPAYADFPVIFLDQEEAVEYCAYEGKRLPTEAEWEKAARGGCEVVPPETCGEEDERHLPWDWPPFGEDEDRLTCERANGGMYVDYYDEPCPHDTSRVGLRPAGRSPYGVDDMLGNVREMVADCAALYAECPGGCVDPWGSCDGWPNPDDPGVAARGGSWDDACYTLVYRYALPRSWLYRDDIGFRCVRPIGGSKAARTPRSGAASGSTEGEGDDDEESNGASGIVAGAHIGMALAGGGERPASTASLSSAVCASTSRLT